MKITRPLNFIDCETTGLDLARDRILELAVVQRRPDGLESSYCWRFNPGVSIPAQLTSLHGISQEELNGCPTFGEKAAEILGVLRGGDLAGFNLVNFDVPLLWEEFYRVGVEWDLADTNVVDVGTIYRTRESRNLANALKFYCNRQHQKAHSALADIRATIDIFTAQLSHYADLADQDVAALATACHVDNRADLAGIILRDRAGDYYYNFAGVAFDRCTATGLKIQDDPGLAQWALSSAFPAHTKLALRKALAWRSTEQAA